MDGYVIMVYRYNLLTRLASGSEHLLLQRMIIGRTGGRDRGERRAGDPDPAVNGDT